MCQKHSSSLAFLGIGLGQGGMLRRHAWPREHGPPAADQSVGKGVAQKGLGLAGFGVGEAPQESCGFITPTSIFITVSHGILFAENPSGAVWK